MNSDFLFPNNAAFSESQSLLLPSQRNTAIVVLTIIVLVMIIPYGNTAQTQTKDNKAFTFVI